MKYLYLALIYWASYSSINAKDVEDSVHVKIGDKIYFASDFINLQYAMKSRLCIKGSNLGFLDLVTTHLKNKNIKIELNNQTLLLAKSHLKFNELQALIIIFKLLQILVDQQVSFQGSVASTISANCLVSQSQSPQKVLATYQKLVYLDDLLAVKVNAEKDQGKKTATLLNIIDSLDKQIKHEILVKFD